MSAKMPAETPASLPDKLPDRILNKVYDKLPAATEDKNTKKLSQWTPCPSTWITNNLEMFKDTIHIKFICADIHGRAMQRCCDPPDLTALLQGGIGLHITGCSLFSIYTGTVTVGPILQGNVGTTSITNTF